MDSISKRGVKIYSDDFIKEEDDCESNKASLLDIRLRRQYKAGAINNTMSNLSDQESSDHQSSYFTKKSHQSGASILTQGENGNSTKDSNQRKGRLSSIFGLRSEDTLQERRYLLRKRQIKCNRVIFTKRQIYLKNTKIFNALYNFQTPNQAIRKHQTSKSFLVRLGEKFPVFEPQNKYLLAWEFLIFLITCIIFFIIPIQLFYMVSMFPEDDFGIICRTIMFFSFSLDTLMNLNIAIYVKGKLITKRKIILKSYVHNFFKSKCLLDIVGLFGLYFGQLSSYTTSITSSSFFCLLFYVRIVNINRFDTIIVKRLQLNRRSKCSYQLLRLAIIVFFISNFFACIFYRVGVLENQRLGYCWYDPIFAKIQDPDPSTEIRYLYSLYWSVTTMISVGYGDVTPIAPMEVLVAIVCMMCSCILFAYSINSIWQLISEVSKGDKRYEQYSSDLQTKFTYFLKRYMRDKSINHKLQKKIQAYLDFHWKDMKSRDEDKESEIISTLPSNLKLQLIFEANSFFFQKFEWSSHFSESFLQLLSQYIKERKYQEDDILYQQSDIDNDCHFYYVDEGEVQLYYDLPSYNRGQGIPIQTIKAGNFLGLYEFFSGQVRNESARFNEFTNLFSISRKDFIDIIKNFPEDHIKFIQLKEEMIYNKNYKLFGLKCYLCDKDDHLSHQCVESQLKKMMIVKNQSKKYLQQCLKHQEDQAQEEEGERGEEDEEELASEDIVKLEKEIKDTILYQDKLHLSKSSNNSQFNELDEEQNKLLLNSNTMSITEHPQFLESNTLGDGYARLNQINLKYHSLNIRLKYDVQKIKRAPNLMYISKRFKYGFEIKEDQEGIDFIEVSEEDMIKERKVNMRKSRLHSSLIEPGDRYADKNNQLFKNDNDDQQLHYLRQSAGSIEIKRTSNNQNNNNNKPKKVSSQLERKQLKDHFKKIKEDEDLKRKAMINSNISIYHKLQSQQQNQLKMNSFSIQSNEINNTHNNPTSNQFINTFEIMRTNNMNFQQLTPIHAPITRNLETLKSFELDGTTLQGVTQQKQQQQIYNHSQSIPLEQGTSQHHQQQQIYKHSSTIPIEMQQKESQEQSQLHQQQDQYSSNNFQNINIQSNQEIRKQQQQLLQTQPLTNNMINLLSSNNLDLSQLAQQKQQQL